MSESGERVSEADLVRAHEGPCWTWGGLTNPEGYGIVFLDEGRRRRRMAHRDVYEAIKGPIPRSLVLDHLCRNRACVNPDHLEPVTSEENTRRGALHHPHLHDTEPAEEDLWARRARAKLPGRPEKLHCADPEHYISGAGGSDLRAAYSGEIHRFAKNKPHALGLGEDLRNV